MQVPQQGARASHGLSRRTILTAAAGVASSAAIVSIPLLTRHGWFAGKGFTRPLVIPPLLFGTPLPDGRRAITLTAAPGRTSLLEGVTSSILAYNGISPGPTIAIRRGTQVRVRVRNKLLEPTTLHWHGAHVPGQADGGPHQVIAVGSAMESTFTLNQAAATLWYHPHVMGRTGPQVYGGLAGLLLVQDDVVATLGLPDQYGVDDLPLVIQDRRFGAGGDLLYRNESADMMGMKGNRFLVNGREKPFVRVPAQWLRLRLLNASNARLYNFGFGDGRPFQCIAGDAGLLPQPVSLSSLLLAPGERAEIMIDLSRDQGRTVMLRHVGLMEIPDLTTMPTDFDNFDFTGVDLLQLEVGPRRAVAGTMPARLSPLSPLPSGAATTRVFRLSDKVDMAPISAPPVAVSDLARAEIQGIPICMGSRGSQSGVMASSFADASAAMFLINGKTMDLRRVDAAVKLGTAEIWDIRNSSHMAHPFHFHGTSFRILSRNGKAPKAHEAGPKDVVLVRPGESVRVVARFDQPADRSAPFMFHCHTLEHEDDGMMGQFTVT